MVPPSARNAGTNKRAQLGLFAGYLLAGAGALVGAVLLVLSVVSPGMFAGLRSMATDAVSPLGEAGAAGRTGGRGFFEAIEGYYRAGSRNAQLQREVEIARTKLAEATALKQENARLKAALGLVDGDTRPVAVARLIGSTSSSARRIGYISAGRNHGVVPGMPVTSATGLIGRVVESGANSSRVLLLTDSESVIPVRRATDDLVAFAEGRSDGSLRLRLINLGVNPIKVGDIFVTSGAGGMFRPGTAVAMATQLTRDGAIAQLLSNPAATDVVIVEPVWQAQAIAALAQPYPAPQPSASASASRPSPTAVSPAPAPQASASAADPVASPSFSPSTAD